MANPTAEAIVTWAEKQAKPSNAPAYRRLTDTDKAIALRYHVDGLTQAEIAQRLGVTQPAISQWLSKCQDSTQAAGLFLRGSALRMAQKIVHQGRPSDHIKALEGINVLAPQQVSGITVQIGIKAERVQLLNSDQAGLEVSTDQTPLDVGVEPGQLEPSPVQAQDAVVEAEPYTASSSGSDK